MRKIALPLLLLLLALTACVKLDVTPRGTESGEAFFAEPGAYRAFLARIYAGLAVTGQQGPSGDPDLQNLDEGFSSYLRQYWQLQELTTESAVIGWTDEGLQDLHFHNWTSDNQFVHAMYSRLYYQIALSNEFLRQTTEEKLNERGVPADQRTEIATFRIEARFLRALSYYHGLDLFGTLPLYVETTPTDQDPVQTNRAGIFLFLEAELHAIKDLLPPPGEAPYGRVDRAAVWALQSQLYLNAEVYTGQLRYDECLLACQRIIASGNYQLEPVYHDLFTTDNHTSPEIIYAIPFDGVNTQTWGGMTYLVHAPLGGRMVPTDYGVEGAWAGLRTTSTLVDLFEQQAFEDRRARFFTNGQSREINRLNDFQQGYAISKFTNLSRAGLAGSNKTFPDTDFPLFRLGAIYLTYAEAVLRGAAEGSREEALGYLNLLRRRAGAAAPLSNEDLTLDFILAERSRELHWEAQRRTDLIRFDAFTVNGVWPWKGGVPEGMPSNPHRRLFPIPEAELLANPALHQNGGY